MDREWAKEAPYKIQASHERIFISDKTLKDPQYPHANLQVLRIDYDPNTGEAQKVLRDADPSTFKLTMAAFPADSVVGKIREILKIEKPSEQDVEKHEKIVAEAKKVVETRDKLQRLSRKDFFINTLKESTENTSHIFQVGQAEYSVATNQQTDWLVTYGADPCYIVSLYDRVNKRGALTHIDATVDGEVTLDRMAGELSLGTTEKRGEFSTYQVTISGGNQGSVADVAKAYEKIKEWQQTYGDNIDVKVGNILQGSGESLALNLNTGEVQRFIPSPALVKDDGEYGTLAITERAMASAVEGKKPAQFIPPK